MQKLENIEQLTEGKLYAVETVWGERVIVFREKELIRSNAQEIQDNKPKPIRIFAKSDIACFEEYAKSN